MVNLAQLALSLLPFPVWRESAVTNPLGAAHLYAPSAAPKSIAIIGAGSGGVAALKTILSLPEGLRADWEVVLYEQRRGVGGLWLPDPNPLHPPELPETPLYPRLRTNTPHPTMTYPGSPFPPNTPLFPTHEYVQQYHADVVEQFNLSSYVKLNHTLVSARWRGDAAAGNWDLEIEADGGGASKDSLRKSFDHLIVASGHNHYPYVPKWNSTEEWLASTPSGTPPRELLHSIFYRNPEKYTNRTVVIVGAGASGRDAALQVGPVARKVYQSLNEGSVPTPGAKVVPKPRISHFTHDAVVFIDGTKVRDVDSLILATGYELRLPFLTAPHSSVVHTDPATRATSATTHGLTDNLRYLFPLWRHIFALSQDFPPTALAFVGLPILIANCPSDIAQATVISHAIANATLLPAREELLAELLEKEESLRQCGFNPYVVGHRLVGGDDEAQDYQDNLIQFLKDKGALREDGKKYVESWRRVARQEAALLLRAWRRVEERGEEDEWLRGVASEEEWADVMDRLRAWQKEWEDIHGQLADDDSESFVQLA